MVAWRSNPNRREWPYFVYGMGPYQDPGRTIRRETNPKGARMIHYSKDPVIDEVIATIVKRADDGMLKYGESLETARGDAARWVQEAIEEITDSLAYLVKLKRTLGIARMEVRVMPKCTCADCLRWAG